MSDEFLTRIDRRIVILRQRLEAAEKMRAMVQADPELARLLLGADESSTDEGGSDKPRRGRGRPPKASARAVHGGPTAAGHFAKVAAFLESKGNSPHSIPDIADATGLKSSSIIQLCYRSHKTVFEAVGVPGHKTKKRWRLLANWRDFVGDSN